MQRSDGTVTYNLAVVVDDVTMEITHVIRGDDHISNTPKQVVIYEALGAAVPEFLHMPLLFGTDKKKLSKRHGATKLEQLTAEGFLVEVVRNYLCFLSTEFDESMITWSLDDLVGSFDVTRLGTSPSIFDPEKLRWMNGRFVRADDRRVARRAPGRVPRRGSGSTATRPGRRSSRPPGPQALAAAVEAPRPSTCRRRAADDEQEALTREVAPLVHEKIEVLADFIPMAGWFFRPLGLRAGGARAAPVTRRRRRRRSRPPPPASVACTDAWDVPAIETLVRELPPALELKPKAVFAALRLGMSGQTVTPGLFESLWVLGRDEAVGPPHDVGGPALGSSAAASRPRRRGRLRGAVGCAGRSGPALRPRQ